MPQPAGVQRYGSKFFELLDIQRFEPEEFISGHDNLVVEGSARYVIRATGRLVKTNWVQIFIFRDGQICRFREYSDMAFWEAWEHRNRQPPPARKVRRTDLIFFFLPGVLLWSETRVVG